MTWRTAIRFPGILGSLAFLVYGAWNCYWWAKGALAPSILLGVFGLPAPTTGMTRSTLSFASGDWAHAFLWNPFTPCFYGLLLWTAVEVAVKFRRKARLLLSAPLVLAWVSVLLAAWGVKFLLGPQWW